MKKLLILLVFLLVLLLPGLFVFNLWSGKENLEKAKTHLLAADFEKAKTTTLNSSRSFQRAKTYLSFFPFLGEIARIGELIGIGETLADAAFHLAKTGELGEKIVGIVLGRETGDLKKITGELKMELGVVWKDLSLIEGELGEKPILEIPEIRKEIEMAQNLLSILPEIFPKEKRSYLFLLQNNMELRPTGGFIGSYALAIFENGKLLDFQVEDVYTADGQLRGHVEPPEAIKKYLGEAGWFLRDSNFDPDFPKTAKQVEWFFQKETGRAVDGVIGINLFVAQKILEALGPVKLSEYNETITADNLFERAEYHSEIGFFPGSTQKRDFLASLTAQIFQEFKQTKKWLEIGKAMWQSLEEKQILVFLNDESAQKVFSQYYWDGSIREASDYLMVVESNFGVNKANYFLKRKLNLEIGLGEEIEEKLMIIYQNDSPGQTWPGGNYKNYLRVYTPLESQLLEVKIDEESLDLAKVDIFSSSGKTVFAFLVEVPVGVEKKVSLRYKIPLKLEDIIPSYSLLFQKQSGMGNDPLRVFISYPSFLKAGKMTSEALTGPQAILYNTNLSRDRVFIVEFTR